MMYENQLYLNLLPLQPLLPNVHSIKKKFEVIIYICLTMVNDCQSYLPSDTPDGLKRYRREELRTLQGNGYRKLDRHHRIYDYDV